MKIIEMGNPPIPEYPKQVKCKKCKTLFEYDKEDVGDNTDPRDNIPDYWVKCPLCKNQITVKL